MSANLFRRRRSKILPTWVLQLLFIVFGVFTLGMGVMNAYRGTVSIRWPAANGTIKSSSTERIGGKRVRYRINILYEYSVNGKIFTGTGVAFGLGAAGAATAGGFVARYPVGKEVKVFYSPDHPEEAVLEPGVVGQSWCCLIVGSLFTALGFLIPLINRDKLHQ
jgi:hypothetical protein